MTWRLPQNPGLGGLDELTSSEETFIQNLAGLALVQGDILYHNGSVLTRLPAGTSGKFLKTLGAGANPLWDTAGGAGTVTSVSVVTANGISGTVATATTTPAITLVLGAITPPSVNISGLTASEIVITDASKNLSSAAVVTYPSLTELTYVKGVTSAIQTQLGLKSPLASPTFTGTVTVPTPFTIGAVSMTATGTELNYVVGVTSAIQTQLNAKAATLAGTINEIAYFNSASTIASLAVATYPSLTELSYVKGVTSAIQTQLGTKQSTITFGTGVLTALGVNVGSAGAPVLFDGALGTPLSGTLTNATGLPAASVVAGILGVTGTRMTKLWATDIESTNMPTVGGTAILTSLTAPQFTTIELGAASDTTLSRVSAGVIAVENVNIPTISSTSTLTNKRVTKRTGTTTSHATPTINTDNVDFYSLTAQAEAITSMTTNLSGTPTENQTLWIAITGTAARAITWGTSFEASTVALPTTTVTTARLDVGFVWNTVTSKWRCIASA